MGDQPLQLLRARVERAVRPVRASESRKDRIREELYAHLWSICEEEQGKEPDRCVNSNGDAPFSPEVIARAIERFGDSDELRLWLQDSVPEMERVLFVRLPWIHRVEDYLQARFERRQNESAARWAGRLAVLFAVLIGFVCFVVNPLVQLLLKPQPNLRKVFIMGGVMVFLTAVNAFLFILLNSGMHGSLKMEKPGKPKSVWGAARYGLLLSLVVFLSGAAFAFTAGRYLIFDSGDLKFLILFSLLAPFVVAFCSIATSTEQNRRREWGGEEEKDEG